MAQKLTENFFYHASFIAVREENAKNAMKTILKFQKLVKIEYFILFTICAINSGINKPKKSVF